MTWYKSQYKNCRAKRTEYNGYVYASKFEAGRAKELDLLKKAGDIKDWERQYKVEIWCYNKFGDKAFKKCHKIDFRVHNLDGSYTLEETKGFETDDYRERRKWLLNLWLPEHPDHDYVVIYQKNGYYRRSKT